ncbi:hypothetical protein SNE40_006152 [Patella caerulea]
MRIVMVGKTGVGKSELGNSLLGYKHFQPHALAGSSTSLCKYGTRMLKDGRKVVVVDTPGTFDTRKSDWKTTPEIIRCMELSSPGPHVFLFVVRIGRYTKEEQDAIDSLRAFFGEHILSYVVVVFTCKDVLVHEHMTLDQFIASNTELGTLLSNCNCRYAAISNWDHEIDRNKDVEAIFDLIQCTIQNNEGDYYTLDINDY